MAASDYWIIRLDGAFAVRSAWATEIEGIPSYGDAQAHILDLEQSDRTEAEELTAALDDFEAVAFGEAA